MGGSLGREEEAGLVELLRGLSPRGSLVSPAELDARCRALLAAPLPRKPRAFLFDVYGTLLASAAGGDPLSGLAAAGGGQGPALRLLEEELGALGIAGGADRFARRVGALILEENTARRAVCAHPEVDIEVILGSSLPPASPGRLRRVAILLESYLNPSSPMPGAAALIGALRIDGRPAGLVSNAQFYTPLLLEALLGGGGGTLPFLPDLTFLSYALGVAKPDEAAFRRAAAELAKRGIEARETLYLGNSFVNDIVPARALGFMTVLFAGDARSFRPAGPQPGAKPIEPDSVVSSLDQFASLAGLA